MNSTDCDSLIEDAQWSDPYSILLLVVLLVIDLIVIIGNCLVVAAVYISSKLRTVTNLFIVSLAVADLLVGIAVLPFSATLESFKVWIFGDIWCSIWLAVDVWMCTASILNLCAISLDRYVAVTRPVNYPSIMSSSRAKILIAGVWVFSFVICFPPLVGWKDSRLTNGSASESVSLVPNYGTIRFRGAHTVITTVASVNTTSDYNEDNVRYRTNFSEQLINSVSSGIEGQQFDEENESIGEKLKTDFYIESTNRLKRAVASFSGVPVISADIYEMQNEPTDTPQAPLDLLPPSRSEHCPWICELTSDRGYVIYSALGSFFIPMAVMLFFYWRIYRAAVLTTRAINQGFRTTKGGKGAGIRNRFDEQRLTLRIHRGRGSVQNHSSSACSSTTNLTTANGGHSSLSASPSTASTGRSPELHKLARIGSRDNKHEQVKISVSYPSNDQINALPASDGSCHISEKAQVPQNNRRSSLSSPKKSTFIGSTSRRSLMDSSTKNKSPKGEALVSVHYVNKNGRDVTETSLCRPRDSSCYLRVSGPRISGGNRNSRGQRSLSIDSTNSMADDESACSRRNSTKSQNLDESADKELPRSTTFDDANSHKHKSVTKMGKRNIKAQVKRFRMETKAAKTLAIIVGGFILCWTPFFTLYLIRAFCVNCINPVVFSLLFWLGYCNSAINPCIYALFSKDFRFAFKKIICRCLCGKEQPMNLRVKRRGSDGSTMKTPMHERRKSCSYNPPNSVGEDSDPAASDSR